MRVHRGRDSDAERHPDARGVDEPEDTQGSEEARLPIDEAIGRYVLDQPLVRKAREQPEVAGPWIVLGLVAAGAALIGGTPALLLVLLVGLPALFGARLLAPRRRDRPSESGGVLRLVLLLAWVAALLASLAVVLQIDSAAGNTGILRIVALAIVLPIAGKALQVILRA